jgi:XTP/dITP diphosphohydrolase
MQLVLASGNKGKLREFQAMTDGVIHPFSDLIEPFEIVEDGETFAANALIKARAVYDKLGAQYVVIADDSGISVPALDGEPGIYSARYAGAGASDRDNLYKLIDTLADRNIERTPAYYTAAIAIVGERGAYIVHGWMHGEVIPQARGDKGFGYDPMFIPEGFEQTLGELDDDIKKGISHRAKALALAKPIIGLMGDVR